MRVALIPARGGSKRIPRKNIANFHGKPIIAYSIEMAIKSGLFDRVCVSTEDKEIANVAQRYGAEIIDRPAEYCRDNVGTQEVTKHALQTFWHDEAMPNVSCCIYATAPLMSMQDLEAGLRAIDNGAIFAFSVGTNPLRDAGQFYWGRAHDFLRDTSLYGPGSTMIPIDEHRVCDINTFDDWTRAEQMYKMLHA